MKLEEIRAAESRLLLSTYERSPVLFVSGEGVYIQDEKGTKYLDLLSGIGVNALGYNHPAIVDTIARQSRALIHTSNLYYHEGQAELALRLTERTGLDRAFFSNTGTEAWEGALKLARAYAGLKRSEGTNIGTKFLALEQSFHGRTFGSMSTTYKAKYREPFGPVVPGVDFVRFNDVADLRAKFSNEVCAILVESIQGEGGIRPLTQEFFSEARALATSTGALLIVDEIQSGMGRTGKWCAYQHYGIQPDVTTFAKPLAGGLPLGAVLCTEEVARVMHAGMEHPPAVIRWQFKWPCEPLANAPRRIEYLIAQSCRIEGGLNAMQILELLWHSVRGSRTGCRDLQHAAMHLNIEGEDMTADVSEDIVRHQKIPEFLGMLQTDLANIRA